MNEDVRGFIQKLRQKACADCVFYVNDWCRHLKKDSHCEDNTEHEAADMIEQLTAELEQVKRERDAAVWELGSGKSCCASCKHDDTRGRDEPCRTCLKSINLFDTPSRYEWRGPCAENGGAEDE